MSHLDQSYWSSRWQTGQTGWDVGRPTSIMKHLIDTFLLDKDARILVPGAGNAYEVEYLIEQGFTNVFVLDWAQEPLDHFKQRNPKFPAERLICSDFFDHSGNYDVILEQTFFCALPPHCRQDYVKQMNSLLSKNGKLVGVLFHWPEKVDGPPYGGSIDEYKQLFSPLFEIERLEMTTHSIAPRSGRECELIARCIK